MHRNLTIQPLKLHFQQTPYGSGLETLNEEVTKASQQILEQHRIENPDQTIMFSGIIMQGYNYVLPKNLKNSECETLNP